MCDLLGGLVAGQATIPGKGVARLGTGRGEKGRVAYVDSQRASPAAENLNWEQEASAGG